MEKGVEKGTSFKVFEVLAQAPPSPPRDPFFK